MGRVTDEWLRDVDRKAAELADEQFPVETAFGPWGDACRLAFAQAVVRECSRLLSEHQMTSADPGTVLECIDIIRSRFGVED